MPSDLQLQETNRVDTNEEEQTIRDEKIPQSRILGQQLIRAQDYKSGRCRVYDDWDRLQGEALRSQHGSPKVALPAFDANHEEDSRHGRPS